MQLKMSFSMEKVLADARVLVNRLKEHDSAADNLIAVTQTMYRRVDSMRQYQEDLNELNEIARHRPRSNLILGLMQENSQIRELQQENKELRGCLEEHQSALELIMSKYREQMFKLMMANKMDRQSKDQTDGTEMGIKVEKICEMAAIMQKAIRIDESEAIRDREQLARLETENKTLRELLLISCRGSQEVSRMERGVQADLAPIAAKSPSLDSSGNQDVGNESLVTTDEDEHHFVSNDMNESVIENKSFVFDAPDKASSPVGTWGRDVTTGSTSSDASTSSSPNDLDDKISVKDISIGISSSGKNSANQDAAAGNASKDTAGSDITSLVNSDNQKEESESVILQDGNNTSQNDSSNSSSC